MQEVYKNCIHIYLNDLEKKQEPPKIWENELPGDSIERILKCPGNSIGKIQEYQENPYGGSTKESCSCDDAPLPSPPSPSMDLQDTLKGIGAQRRRWLHRTLLNLQELDFQMPDISIKNFPIFFGNTSKDAKKNLLKFKITCDIFNIYEDIVTCQLFAQTLHGNACEWLFSLFPGTITNWDVLETSIVEKFLPIMHPYALSGVFNVVSHPPSPILTQDNEVSDLEEKYNQRLEFFFESSHIVQTENENFNFQVQDLSFLYTPYEDISGGKFYNEIEESPPNVQ